jgi:hypothetical protein
MNDPRYPIGKFQRRDSLTGAERVRMIDTIAAAPPKMRSAVAGRTPTGSSSR